MSMCNPAYLRSVTRSLFHALTANGECNELKQISHPISDNMDTDYINQTVNKGSGFYGPSVLPVAVTVTAALALYATGSFQHALGSVSGISHVSPHC